MSDERKKVGIIGGGNIGLQFLDLFGNSQHAVVSYVVDLKADAPAVVEARRRRIATYTGIEQALVSNPVDFVIEVTGSEKVIEILSARLDRTRTRLITHDMAYILITVVSENDARMKTQVGQEILGIQGSMVGSLKGMNDLIENVSSITSDMRLLSLNARIEAARVGEQGRGFAIVAQQMTASVDKILEITQEIEKITQEISGVLDRIKGAIQKLM